MLINLTGCNVNGKYYPEGEMIVGYAKECENCYCVDSQIRCNAVVCSLAATTDQHCLPLYTAGHCCPTGFKCK